jgi:hypothetical protein
VCQTCLIYLNITATVTSKTDKKRTALSDILPAPICCWTPYGWQVEDRPYSIGPALTGPLLYYEKKSSRSKKDLTGSDPKSSLGPSCATGGHTAHTNLRHRIARCSRTRLLRKRGLRLSSRCTAAYAVAQNWLHGQYGSVILSLLLYHPIETLLRTAY